MSRRNNSRLWEYLENSGVLENGTDEEIKAAKKAYRKEYLLQYKRDQRAKNPEYSINLSGKKGEHSTIQTEAKRHNMSIASFIKKAALAYMRQEFVLPNEEQIIRIEQAVADCLNEIQAIVKERDRYFWDKERKFSRVEKRIEKLEEDISRIFRNPPLKTIDDRKNQNI